MLVALLSGCSHENSALKQGLAFRTELLNAEGCQFAIKVTADYGDELYSFVMNCKGDKTGTVTFQISEPESLSGITGKLSDTGGTLTFDNTALCFPLLADDHLSPASAPWVFLKTLRSGYLTSACMEDELLRLTMDDSYAEDALHLDIWIDNRKQPVRADILYDGKRILSLEVTEFAFL